MNVEVDHANVDVDMDVDQAEDQAEVDDSCDHISMLSGVY